LKPPFWTSERSEIAYEILAYLVEHADAQDTLEGITEWWLLGRGVRHRAPEVKEALALLTAQGLVLESQGKDARVRYRINRRQYKKILALLEERPS
jgi:Fe2+ or Zn2+ uptake regulation protein